MLIKTLEGLTTEILEVSLRGQGSWREKLLLPALQYVSVDDMTWNMPIEDDKVEPGEFRCLKESSPSLSIRRSK